LKQDARIASDEGEVSLELSSPIGLIIGNSSNGNGVQMNRIAKIALAFAATTMGVVPPAHAGGFLGDVVNTVTKAVSDTGHAVEKAAHDTGHAVEKATSDTGHSVETAAHDTGHAVEKATADTGHAIETAAHDTGHSLEKAAGDTGHALEKATHDTGNALEKAAHDTGHAAEGAGQFIKDHPWETVIAVALIAGGGYLIVYQGYVLSVTVQGVSVVTVTTGATSGVLVGSGLTAAGVGAEVAAFYAGGPRHNDSSPQIGRGQNTSTGSGGSPSGPRAGDPGGADSTPGQLIYRADVSPQEESSPRSPVFQRNNRPTVVVGAKPSLAPGTPLSHDGNAPRAVGAVVVQHYGQSVMYEPRLAKNPSDMQRYNFAHCVTDWAEKTLPVGQFDPDSPNTISNVELKILDAITALHGVKGFDDEEAEEQRRERMNPLPSIALEQAIEINKDIWWKAVKGETAEHLFTLPGQMKLLIGEGAPSLWKGALMAGAPELGSLVSTGTLYGVLLHSTATSDGIKEASEAAAAALMDRLNAYNQKREKKFGKPSLPPMQTVEKLPQGPVIQEMR
jgi:ElaB/YqjD/DUF883 family membrane-anchored ribosome-binding protein